MSDDQPLRSQQRYSRFSRSRYADYKDLPPQDLPEDTSLADIAERALRNDRSTADKALKAAPSMEPQRDQYARRESERSAPPPKAADIRQEESWLRDMPPPPEPYVEETSDPVEAPVPEEPAAPAANGSRLFTGAVPANDESELRAERLARGPAATARPTIPPPLPEAVKLAQAERDRNLSRETVNELQPIPLAKFNKAGTPLPPAKTRSGPGVAARSAEFAGRCARTVRAKAVPVLTKSAFWLANNLRRRELRKRYCEAIVLTHNKLLDRRLEKLFRIPTVKMQRMTPAPGIAYEGPVPSKVFNWIMSPVPADLREFAFIDMRSGRGRTMMLAAKRNFDRIIGFEFDEQLYDDLRMNIAQFPRSLMVCRDIDCYRGDIDGISLPDQPCVIYFSSAWREPMLAGVMDYIRHTYRQSPRRIYIVLENVDNRVTVEDDGIFHRIEPAIAERLKLRLFSPMDFRIYRTTV